MDSQALPTPRNEMVALREGIRAKYRTYQQVNQDRYPAFDFNTSRANYEPLRESFEEEFFVVRGYKRDIPTIAIPSTSTLAQLFTDDSYVPGKKILNTCQSYAEGAAKPAGIRPAPDQLPAMARRRWLVGGGLLLLLSLGVFALSQTDWFRPAPSGLVITRPTHQSVVPRESVIEGHVTNAKTVWIVARSVYNDIYWVGQPTQVDDNGFWRDALIIGSKSASDNGYTYQLRVFVNPTEELIAGTTRLSWPKAELASDICEVLRGPDTK